MNSIYESNPDLAYRAGFAYWQRNKPYHAMHEGLASCARSRGWHGRDMHAWLDGFYDAKHSEPYNDYGSYGRDRDNV